jgi:hypothetical protein
MADERDELTTAESPSPSKRALLKAAWVAPVVLSVTVPRVVMAQASVPAPPPPSSLPPP